jgi:hypothetical protein
MADQDDIDRQAEGGRGARVLRTGIALVHEGELVLPAVGSEAQAETVLANDRAVINYYFPVEVEVRVSPAPVNATEVVERVLRRAIDKLERL